MKEKGNQLLEKEAKANEQKEIAEQLRPDQLYGVLKAFDHIRDYDKDQLEEMYKTIYTDLVTYRFPQMKPDHLKRNEKELKDARYEYEAQKQKGNDPLPVHEELTADDLIQFVYQNAIGNKGVDLQEVVNDKFNRLQLNVLPEEEEQFENTKKALAPELILLAKIKLEQRNKEIESGRESTLPVDAKLNREAVDNIDAVGLAFQLKSMPNVSEPKDMLNWGYTSREAIFLYDWSKKAQNLLDPEGTGQISFGTEEEMQVIANQLEDETEKIYPTEANLKRQKQAMLRRMMKYIKHQDVLLHRKGPESIGLEYKETEKDKAERLVYLIEQNLYEDTELEPKETRDATKNFREYDIVKIVESILAAQYAEGEGQSQALADLVELLGEHYTLFNSIEKDEAGLPEMYNQSIRQEEAKKASDRIIEFIRLSVGQDMTQSEFGDNVKKYIRLLVELDHNASLRRSVFQKGAGISNELFTELEEQEKQLTKRYSNQLQELDDAIGVARLRPSERLRKIELAEPSTQEDLEKTKRILSGDAPLISPDIAKAQKRMNEVQKQRQDLLFLKGIFEEKLGIKA